MLGQGNNLRLRHGRRLLLLAEQMPTMIGFSFLRQLQNTGVNILFCADDAAFPVKKGSVDTSLRFAAAKPIVSEIR